MGDGDGTDVHLPGVDIPGKDQVLDGADNLLLGIPDWGWTIIAAIIVGMILKSIIKGLNFKLVSVVLIALFLAAYFGAIGK